MNINSLILWYGQNKRDLPWRNTDDPYKIWISEIILQQTRVAQGLDYYLRFVERFPDVQTLADASEDEVLKYWQGLGYYSRARNLHKAAKQIQELYRGIFPKTFEEVIKLAGVGIYTASAICSFAYDLPHAVVDGNVYRVLSRLFNIDTPIDSTEGVKKFSLLAQQLLDLKHPGFHNQAIMEFGALQCVPASPDCESCPLQSQCLAFANGTLSKLPVKSLKTKVTKRYFNYLHFQYRDFTFLQKRTANDVWKSLYEFPLIEADRLLDVEELLGNQQFLELTQGIEDIHIRSLSHPVKHILTHRQIFARFITIEVRQLNDGLKNIVMTENERIEDFAVSRLMEMFIRNQLT